MVPVVILAMHVVYLDVSWSDWMAIAVIGLYLISAALCMVEYSKHRGRFVLEVKLLGLHIHIVMQH